MLKWQQNLLLCCVITSFLLPINFAFTTQYYGNTKHPVLNDHCFYADLNLSVPIGKPVYPTNIEYTCVKITCRDDYVLMIKHCERFIIPHGCVATSYDYTKRYPACCAKVVC